MIFCAMNSFTPSLTRNRTIPQKVTSVASIGNARVRLYDAPPRSRRASEASRGGYRGPRGITHRTGAMRASENSQLLRTRLLRTRVNRYVGAPLGTNILRVRPSRSALPLLGWPRTQTKLGTVE